MNTPRLNPATETVPPATLFELPPGEATPSAMGATTAPPRLRRPDRRQIMLRPVDLEGLLPEDHRARVVWAYVEGLDLSPLYQQIRAVEGGQGRDATDPRILLALWLFATLEGIGSARYLNRLCVEHHAYQWIAGGVTLNYHTLADFRTGAEAFLNAVLTQSVATLLEQGLVRMKRVAQDGMRVRASAGASSFRRRPTLEHCLAEAEKQVQALRAELEANPGATKRRQQKARERAARERQERIQAALQCLPELEAKKKAEDRTKARASTTDPEATVMKMGDGGYRPAYNVQFSTDTETKIIVGVEVSTAGSDAGLMPPMVEQVQERYAQTPAEVLVDGGFAQHEDIEKVSQPEVGCTVYAPVPKSRNPDVDEHAPHRRDSVTVAEWRQRMGTPEAKAIYHDRAATAEWVNAQARNRGLRQFSVRGATKIKAVLLWYILANNLMQTVTLRAEAARQTAGA
jgi:transposase